MTTKSKLHRFQFSARNQGLFPMNEGNEVTRHSARFSGTANSNILSKMSREPRELPWQRNVCKSKPKLQ